MTFIQCWLLFYFALKVSNLIDVSKIHFKTTKIKNSNFLAFQVSNLFDVSSTSTVEDMSEREIRVGFLCLYFCCIVFGYLVTLVLYSKSLYFCCIVFGGRRGASIWSPSGEMTKSELLVITLLFPSNLILSFFLINLFVFGRAGKLYSFFLIGHQLSTLSFQKPHL